MKKLIPSRSRHSVLLQLALIIGVAISAIAFQSYAVFTQPTVAPPGGNIAGPINTGLNPQAKAGKLTIGVPPSSQKKPLYSFRVFGKSIITNGLLLNQDGATNGLFVYNGNVIVNRGSIAATKFIDQDFPRFYVDPASGSNLDSVTAVSLQVNGALTFHDGTTQRTAYTKKNPVMIASGKKCIPNIPGVYWYPPAGWYNFTGVNSVIYLELHTSSGWGGGDNSGANAGTMWVDGSNMRFDLRGSCVYWQKLKI